MSSKYREPTTYFIVGVIVTLVDWVTYSLLVKFAHLGVTPSNTIAWIVAVLVAYILNRKYVFLSEVVDGKGIFKEFIGFVGGRIFSGLVVIVLTPLLMHLGITQTIFGVEGFIAKGIASVIGMILNYFLSKYLVFKK